MDLQAAMKSRLSLLAALLSLLLCTSHFSVSFAQDTKAAKAPENPKEQPVAGLEAAAAAAVGAGGQVRLQASLVVTSTFSSSLENILDWEKPCRNAL